MIDPDLKRYCLIFVFRGVTRQHSKSFDELEDAKALANDLVKVTCTASYVIDQTIEPPADMVVYTVKRQ